MIRHFQELLTAKWQEEKFVCVGLDSDYEKIPVCTRKTTLKDTIVSFNQQIVDATKDQVCAYKPNIAFYESFGPEGIAALADTIKYIRDMAYDVPVILDAKRADIGSTNAGYVRAAFSILHADAITVHPYLGREALDVFLTHKDKGIFVLCRTSNPGAGEFQDLIVHQEPLYLFLARQVATLWNTNANCGLVVGATYPQELQKVREMAPDLPFLIPGIGAQGGDLEKVVKFGRNHRGHGIIVNSSRGIIFASKKADFADVARKEVLKLNDSIQRCCNEKPNE